MPRQPRSSRQQRNAVLSEGARPKAFVPYSRTLKLPDSPRPALPEGARPAAFVPYSRTHKLPDSPRPALPEGARPAAFVPYQRATTTRVGAWATARSTRDRTTKAG